MDNGGLTSLAVQGRGSFTGTVTVSPTGEVSIANAAPGGVHTITIRATDNCGAITDATIRVTVNTPPMISPVSGIARQAGSAGSSTVIASVNDVETVAGSLVVTVAAAAGGSTSGGVAITGLINNSGAITAVVTAVCGAGAGSVPVTLQVSDGIDTVSAVLNVTVSANTPPLLSYGPSQVRAGAATTVTPAVGPSDNGSVSTFLVQGSPGFSGVLSVDSRGSVAIGSAAPVGVHSITVRAGDNCGLTTEAVFQLTVTSVAVSLLSASPDRLIAGGGSVELAIDGSGFIAGMLARVNGENRPTQVVSATRIIATILSADIARAGVLSLTVADPFGSVSSPLAITIYDRITVTTATSYAVGEVSPDSMSVAFAVGIATGVRVADSVPLPSRLLGTRVSIRDSNGVVRDQPLFFVSPQQVNFLLHPQTAPGRASVTIYLDDKVAALGTIDVVRVSPGLFTQNSTGDGVPAAYALRVSGDNQAGVAISAYNQQQASWQAIPIDLGSPADQVYLVLFGSGMRGGTGVSGITATLNERSVPVVFLGADSYYAGLDQLNIGPIPRSLVGAGLVDLVISVDGKRVNPGKSLRVFIKIGPVPHWRVGRSLEAIEDKNVSITVVGMAEGNTPLIAAHTKTWHIEIEMILDPEE
jgi:uncharacterized protein (TIGR03437 family)